MNPNRCSRILTNVLNCRNFAVFPEKTDDGCVIFYHKQNDPKARNFNYDLNIQLVLMQVDAVLHDDPPKGAIYVYDVEGV